MINCHNWQTFSDFLQLGHSPLMICSVSQPRSDQDWSVVEKILDLGDVNQASSFSKQTPLMNAASRGCVQMVRLLLEAGADPNLQDSDGSTALMYASVHGHEACDQQTACSVALAAGHKEIALRIYLHSKKRCKDSK
ncbi:KN motif and ankyrin repeat domain-containing protein 1, partial [Araneus ventricosus]